MNQGEAPRSDAWPESRRAVWVAMSNLWLDNELQEWEIEHIAGVLRESGITEAEAERIFVGELAPFLGWNHWSIAGVWDGFDPDWVCQEAGRRAGRRGSLLARIAGRLGLTTYAARPAWVRVKRTAFG